MRTESQYRVAYSNREHFDTEPVSSPKDALLSAAKQQGIDTADLEKFFFGLDDSYDSVCLAIAAYNSLLTVKVYALLRYNDPMLYRL